MSGNKIAGIIFDMDGVLCDSEPFIYEAARNMFAERYGAAVTRADFEPFVGAGEDRYLGGVAEKYGIRLAMPEDKRRVYEIYLRLIKGRLAPLPGAADFIARCRSLGLKLAVATSADRVKLAGNLAEIGFPETSFDATVSGGEAARKKPAPDIFLIACRKLALPPAACVVVEDAPNGVRAACAAGISALGVTTGFPAETLCEAGATWVTASLAPAELRDWFAEIADAANSRIAPGTSAALDGKSAGLKTRRGTAT